MESAAGGPSARAEWFLATRLARDPNVRDTLYAEGSRQRHRIERAQRDEQQALPLATPGGPGTVNWTPIGPSVVAHGQGTNNPPVSGRITALVVGSGGTRTYARAANGGCWFTDDGGATWMPLDDYVTSGSTVGGKTEADSLAVGAVDVRFGATAATDLVYVGTGEPNGYPNAYFGVGIRRSPAGGAPGTWTLEATNLAGFGIYKVAIDPDDPNLVLAATTAGLVQRPAAAPFDSWLLVTSTFATPNGFVTDLVVAGRGASKRYYCVFPDDTAYSSRDGATWTPLTGLPAGGRIALAVAESDATIAYALKDNGRLYRLVGTAFHEVASVAPVFPSGYGSYAIAVAVDPANANTVYLMGDALWDVNGNWTSACGKARRLAPPRGRGRSTRRDYRRRRSPTSVCTGAHDCCARPRTGAACGRSSSMPPRDPIPSSTCG